MIYQLVHTLTQGDAISSEVLALSEVFTSLGIQNGIIALHSHDRYKPFTKKPGEVSLAPDDKLILHYSIGSELNTFFSTSQTKKAVIFHNITPPGYFEGINHRLRDELSRGWKELPDLLVQCDLVVADSHYNAEQISLFNNNIKVLDLCVSKERFELPPALWVQSMLRKSGRRNILHVGRIVPNKCYEDLIKVLFFIRNHQRVDADLWLVGTDIDNEVYRFNLQKLVDELSLNEHVHFTGGLDDDAVRAFYETSDLYLLMSEHEGFCLPVLEAMHSSLPIIAFSAGAVTSTLGEGGVLVKRKDHAEIASLSAKIFRDEKLRERITIKGKEELNRFTIEAFKENALKVFSGF